MGEWTGPWSDGAAEWTPYWMNLLGHKFGNDGVFWMSYEDMLKRFDLLDRTRLFGVDWTVVQHWTSASVSWVTGYLNTKFSVEIKKAGPTVFVLCQVRYRFHMVIFRAHASSLMIATFAVSTASTTLTCTSYSKKKTPLLANTLFEPAVRGLVTAVSRLRSISRWARMRFCLRLRPHEMPTFQTYTKS